jgi:tripartite-type tricarboxylate transporter receptor subunit TctC
MHKVKLLLLALAVFTPGNVERVPAQAFPTRPITVVVPFSAGATTDVIARIIAERMRQSLGQPVIIENVTGAAGSIAVGRTARAAPDGYMLVSGHWGTMVVNGATYELPYDVRSALHRLPELRSAPTSLSQRRPSRQATSRASSPG